MKTGKIIALFALVFLLSAAVIYNVVFGAQRGTGVPEIVVPSDGNTVISLMGSSAEVSGKGASVKGGTITVTEPGTYRVLGTLSDGHIDVDANGDVILVLDGAVITNSSGPAISVTDADSFILYLEDGSQNSLTSGKEAKIDGLSADSSAAGGALTLSDSSTIAGKGSLTVCGYINNGIHCSNDLLISSGTISVTAVNNGIKGKDSLTVDGGDITVLSGGDGLKSDDEEGEETGVLTINGGTLSIISYDEGMQAFRSIELNGGTLNISSKDDGIHCDGSIILDGADVTMACSDDGLHAEDAVTIASGNLTITSSTEGIEGKTVTIDGGDISVTASDDGINCSSDDYTGRPWGRPGSSSAQKGDMPVLTINCGTLYINAQGDGLDSNGNIVMNGGYVIVDGPSGNGNGALDSGAESGGTITVNGGTLLAIGSYAMVEVPDDTSTQCSLSYSTAFQPGDVIRVTDGSGKVLIDHTAAKSGGNVVFSSPDLEKGQTYTVTIGSGSYEMTLSGTVTTAGGGNGFGGGFGGGGFGGGGFGGGGFPGGNGNRPDGNSGKPDENNGNAPDSTEPPEGTEPPEEPGSFSGGFPEGGGDFGDFPGGNGDFGDFSGGFPGGNVPDGSDGFGGFPGGNGSDGSGGFGGFSGGFPGGNGQDGFGGFPGDSNGNDSDPGGSDAPGGVDV